MGQFAITYPDITDIDLVFDKSETKQILIFFYPSYQNRIVSSEIGNDARRLAQTMLVAAVDTSCTMSYVEAMVASLRFLPGSSVKKWSTKLTKGLAKQWFKNATQKDLLNAHVYDSVRKSIARNCASMFHAVLSGDGIAGTRMSRKAYVFAAGVNTSKLV